MKKYSWLIFDADNTLYDFRKTETIAFQKSFAASNLPYQPDYLPLYHQVNQQLWTSFEQGQVSQEELKRTRFPLFFNKANLRGNPETFSKNFITFLAAGNFLLAGAEKLVRKLARHFQMLLLTNGLQEVQRPRFEKSKIYPYFADIIVSGEVGFAKPAPEIFEIAFARMASPPKTHVLIIGDSLTSDMQGGLNFGIDTCWYNPKQKPRVPNLKITYEIHKLEALESILSL